MAEFDPVINTIKIMMLENIDSFTFTEIENHIHNIKNKILCDRRKLLSDTIIKVENILKDLEEDLIHFIACKNTFEISQNIDVHTNYTYLIRSLRDELTSMQN
jgi:hypothetical protein